MKQLSSRSKLFKESRIREMTILSNRYEAINLSQGFPEFDPPAELKKALEAQAKTAHHQYAPNWGIDDLRSAIAEKQSKGFGREIIPNEEVLVTVGSTEAMISTMMAVLDPGDKVIIFSPYYNSYALNAAIVGAEPIFVSLKGKDFTFDENELEDAFKQGAKALILCNPSNPCGKVFTKNELEIIANLAKKYDAYVFTDEVYEHIIYGDNKHINLASLQGMFERTVTCTSLSKTYSVTGWRLGYVTAPFEILEQIRKFHDVFTVCAPTPMQYAAVNALRFGDEYYAELKKVYTAKKERFIKALDDLDIAHNEPQGTYFVLTDISKYGYKSDLEFAKLLVKDYGIAGVPGSCFFAENENRYIRFHFAKNDDTLDEVARRFERLENDRIHGRIPPEQKG